MQIRRNSHYRKRGAAAPKSEDLSDGILLEISSLGNRGNGQICVRFFVRVFVLPCRAFFGFSLKYLTERKAKTMKKNFERILALILALVMVLAFAACNLTETGDDTDNGAGEQDAVQKTATLVLETDPKTEFEIDLNKVEITNGLLSVLDYLKAEGKLDYTGTSGYLDKVGTLENDAAAGKYIYIYTSVVADADVSQYATTVEYNGMTLTSSGVGASDMHIEDGAVIYIGLISWS